ncbi:hypothetical protein ASD15_28745 [Massilia sp. Root351]|jgi:hypothetical protein|uniref:DUF2867 domain-containing protein n=1 Tax=Massilia sp. Root351 TaxID=1736522 RepID=UPI0007091A42|nr:DUF2867 domain-containing protein [Massilia sp. Root351]KQV87228.1 hypothetical protein ASD15_28745 [Massilia sp. Root351]
MSGAPAARPPILAVPVPRDSEIAAHLAGSDFHDCYQMPIAPTGRTALELYLEVVARTPGWVNRLMALRNSVVGLFGLKNLGHLNGATARRPASEYKLGDRVGIFSILYLSDDEVILGDTDKHLKVRVSVRKLGVPRSAIAVATVVHIHNLLGRVYMLFVAPVHKRIVPAVLARYRAGDAG